MTNAQVVGIGIRLFAVWLVVYVLQNAPMLWLFGSREIGSAWAKVAVAVSVLMIFIAALLWCFPLKVASKLIPESSLSEKKPLPVAEFERTGFCLLGLWVLSQAIPLSGHYGYLLFHSLKHSGMVELGLNIPAGLVHALLQLAIGIWLLFGAKGLLGLLRWARHAGS
jgi:hypothetical protein